MGRKTEWTYESFPERDGSVGRVGKNVFQRYMDRISDERVCRPEAKRSRIEVSLKLGLLSSWLAMLRRREIVPKRSTSGDVFLAKA